MPTNADPFDSFKAMQREVWSNFALNEGFTTAPAAALVQFARVTPADKVLDVACGTAVVAVTAARLGAKTAGLDLTPGLLERARENAVIANVEVELIEGDAEKLPFPDGSFDVVLSQFGHIFAPRPELATAEMLRVLKPRGRIAFTTWPPEHETGQLFALLSRHMPPSPEGAPKASPPILWGDPNVIRTRLGESVADLHFERGNVISPALSPEHILAFLEFSFGPLKRLVAGLSAHPDRLATLRAESLAIIGRSFANNVMHQGYLMSRATKL